MILIDKIPILWVKDKYQQLSPTRVSWFRISGTGTKTLVFYILCPKGSNAYLSQETKSQVDLLKGVQMWGSYTSYICYPLFFWERGRHFLESCDGGLCVTALMRRHGPGILCQSCLSPHLGVFLGIPQNIEWEHLARWFLGMALPHRGPFSNTKEMARIPIHPTQEVSPKSPEQDSK